MKPVGADRRHQHANVLSLERGIARFLHVPEETNPRAAERRRHGRRCGLHTWDRRDGLTNTLVQRGPTGGSRWTASDVDGGCEHAAAVESEVAVCKRRKRPNEYCSAHDKHERESDLRDDEYVAGDPEA